MKKLIILILILSLLFSFTGCQSDAPGILDMPAKTMAPYPEIESVKGYDIYGKVTDLAGLGLAGASITVNDKVKAITDQNGDYYIKALEGVSTVGVSFYDYEFKSATQITNTKKEINFEGSSDFKIEMMSKTENGATLFGVEYVVDYNADAEIESKKKYSDVTTGIAYNLYNEGKTTVTPRKTGFTFYPESVDIYTGNQGNPFTFLAVPNENTFSVSGTLYFEGGVAGSNVSMYVNGIKQSNSVVTTIEGIRRTVYKLDGLTYAQNGSGYVITAGGNRDTYISLAPQYINSERTAVDFDMVACKNIDLELDFGKGSKPEGTYTYKVIVEHPDYADPVFEEEYTNKLIASNVIVVEGAKVRVVSSAFDSYDTKVTADFMANVRDDDLDIDCIVRNGN